MVKGVLIGLLAGMILLSSVGVVGTAAPGSIHGRVFEDLNSDGVCVGTGEPGLAGILIELAHESNATIWVLSN